MDLRAQLEEKEAEIGVLRSALVNQDPELHTKLEKTMASHDKLAKALSEAEGRLRTVGASRILDPELDAALIELAQSKPEIMTYDPDLGMVQLHSDLTFDLGSDQVSERAIGSLRKLARILESPTGKGYTVRIEGHTDNVPIGRPATRDRHPTNWHLSVHRAIAVKDVLVRAGVEQTRMGVAGFGENRPIEPNGAKGNQANRRVEIYLVRSGATGLSDEPVTQTAVSDSTASSSITPTGSPRSDHGAEYAVPSGQYK